MWREKGQRSARETGCVKRDAGHLPMQTTGDRTDPGHSASIPKQTRDHLKFEDKMGRGGEAARKHEEDFTPEEPPSSLSRPTVSGEQ